MKKIAALTTFAAFPEIRDFFGFEPDEKVVSMGVTIMSRDGLNPDTPPFWITVNDTNGKVCGGIFLARPFQAPVFTVGGGGRNKQS